jgi:hypothetical protein
MTSFFMPLLAHTHLTQVFSLLHSCLWSCSQSSRQQFTSVLADSDDRSVDLPIQLVQGIDIWKEQRFQEEGIENVQNLATADVFSLAVETHYPLRTLIDWIDQAIFIQRFSASLKRARDSSLAVSAIELAWLAPCNENQGSAGAAKIAQALGVDSS